MGEKVTANHLVDEPVDGLIFSSSLFDFPLRDFDELCLMTGRRKDGIRLGLGGTSARDLCCTSGNGPSRSRGCSGTCFGELESAAAFLPVSGIVGLAAGRCKGNGCGDETRPLPSRRRVRLPVPGDKIWLNGYCGWLNGDCG